MADTSNQFCSTIQLPSGTWLRSFPQEEQALNKVDAIAEPTVNISIFSPLVCKFPAILINFSESMYHSICVLKILWRSLFSKEKQNWSLELEVWRRTSPLPSLANFAVLLLEENQWAIAPSSWRSTHWLQQLSSLRVIWGPHYSIRVIWDPQTSTWKNSKTEVAWRERKKGR